MADAKKPLKLITAPPVGSVVNAPPVMKASDNSIDYTCGRCDTILLHAEEGQVRGVIFRCSKCGSYNATEA